MSKQETKPCYLDNSDLPRRTMWRSSEWHHCLCGSHSNHCCHRYLGRQASQVVRPPILCASQHLWGQVKWKSGDHARLARLNGPRSGAMCGSPVVLHLVSPRLSLTREFTFFGMTQKQSMLLPGNRKAVVFGISISHLVRLWMCSYSKWALGLCSEQCL